MHVAVASVPQTPARIVASNSIRTPVCVLFVATMVCGVVLDKLTPAIEKEMSILPDKMLWLYQVTLDENHKQHVAPIHTALLMSSVDTTNYSNAGCWSKPKTLQLVHSYEHTARPGHSLYYHKKLNMSAGVRFQKAHTISAI